jgi:hypothetical protein
MSLLSLGPTGSIMVSDTNSVKGVTGFVYIDDTLQTTNIYHLLELELYGLSPVLQVKLDLWEILVIQDLLEIWDLLEI